MQKHFKVLYLYIMVSNHKSYSIECVSIGYNALKRCALNQYVKKYIGLHVQNIQKTFLCGELTMLVQKCFYGSVFFFFQVRMQNPASLFQDYKNTFCMLQAGRSFTFDHTLKRQCILQSDIQSRSTITGTARRTQIVCKCTIAGYSGVEGQC